MNRRTKILIDIVINVVISAVLYLILEGAVFGGESPFNSRVQGFLAVYITVTILDLIWKLVKHKINKKFK